MSMRSRLAFSLAPLLLIAGCLPVIEVKTRTQVFPDGSVARDTTYKKIRRKADDDMEKEWNQRALSEDLGSDLLNGIQSFTETDDTLVLRGQYQHVRDMPSDFRRDVADLEATSRNRISLVQKDILIGTHLLYRERFDDAISPEDQKEARNDFVQFLTRFCQSVVKHEFGQTYDTSLFNTWTREDLTPVLKDMVEIFWQERKLLSREDPVTGKTGFERMMQKMSRRVSMMGVTFDPTRDLDEGTNLVALQEFTTQLLARTLVPHGDGIRKPKAEDFHYLFAGENPMAGIELAAERAAELEYGSVKKCEEVFKKTTYALTGTYSSPPAEAEFRFDCTLFMPGVLLRSNGFLDGAGGTFWIFEGQELYPHGFIMEAESVVIDTSVTSRIREIRSDLDLHDVTRLMVRLDGTSREQRTKMREALKLCARAGTLQAISDYEGLSSKQKKKLQTIVEAIQKTD